MKYVVSHTGGRLANQLYFVLQAYCQSKKLNQQLKYIQTTASAAFTDLSQYAAKLNIQDFFADFSPEMRDEDTIVLCDGYYYQFIDKDFMEDDLNRFISLTILASRHFWETRSQIDSIETTCAIHIRNGDFLEIDKYNCFDRAEYLSKAVSLFPSYVDKAVVFSDDIDICKRDHFGILSNRFNNVVFESGNDQLDDFYKLSCYRHKVLWNSTFSYWSGFISDMVYGCKNLVCCPKLTMKGESADLRCKKHWVKA